MDEMDIPTLEGMEVSRRGPMVREARPFTGEEITRANAIRVLAEQFELNLSEAEHAGCNNAYLEQARLRLQEAVMWAVKGIGER
ncbi:MAG: hypothetical protein SVU69_00490 [Pseudomonadota bacterium]|nr:hypothetical protein [Pseudomonadota bacterium]